MEEAFTLTVTPQELDKRGFVRQTNLVEGKRLLCELYGKIWCEACYDPTNRERQAFASELLPLIKQANDLLEFKR